MIVTGVRAYERRADLRAYNRRLLDFVERGGTVIVQYNKMEFNREDYGPYPAKVSGNRVSDEPSPVKVLVPNDPVFNFPNKIGPAAWANWVQERGLYFIGEKDPKYIDLVSMTDSFKDNPAKSSARWSKPNTERAAGSISGSASGGNCPPEPPAPISYWRICSVCRKHLQVRRRLHGEPPLRLARAIRSSITAASRSR